MFVYISLQQNQMYMNIEHVQVYYVYKHMSALKSIQLATYEPCKKLTPNLVFLISTFQSITSTTLCLFVVEWKRRTKANLTEIVGQSY